MLRKILAILVGYLAMALFIAVTIGVTFAVLGAIRAACSAALMSSADGLFSARLSNMLLTKAVAASENSEPSAARSSAGSF